MKANIYVSATYRDLTDHRKAVCNAIRALGHVDVAMEHYVAEPTRPLVRCLNDVRRCDLYIGIFARRYGFIPKGFDRSITEQEFRAALKHKKDVLCFLLAEDAEWPTEFVDSDSESAKLEALRSEISDTYLAGFFSTPEDLATKVSQAIVKALALGETPLDIERENRLMRDWRHGERKSRTRARHALINMGSPRYAAAVKDLLLEAKERADAVGGDFALAVEEIASYLEELLGLVVNSRQAMPVLLDLFHSNDEQIRVFSVFNVGELGLRGKEIDPEIVRRLLELESDKSPDVRGELAHTLGKIHHFNEILPDVNACLQRLAEDTVAAVCGRASESLDRLAP